MSRVVFSGVLGPGSLLSFCHTTTDVQGCGQHAVTCVQVRNTHWGNYPAFLMVLFKCLKMFFGNTCQHCAKGCRRRHWACRAMDVFPCIRQIAV